MSFVPQGKKKTNWYGKWTYMVSTDEVWHGVSALSCLRYTWAMAVRQMRARRRHPPVDDYIDEAMEALAEALRKFDAASWEGGFLTYVRIVVKRRLVDFDRTLYGRTVDGKYVRHGAVHRYLSGAKTTRQFYYEREPAVLEYWMYQDPQEGPDVLVERLEEADLEAWLRDRLQDCPPAMRQVLEAQLDGRTYEEMVEKFGKTLGTISALRNHGLNRLRKFAREDGLLA